MNKNDSWSKLVKTYQQHFFESVLVCLILVLFSACFTNG